MRKFRKKLARFMVVVVASSMLANFYSAAAFAKEITDACEADDNCSVQPYAGEDCEDAGCEIVSENTGVGDVDEAVNGDVKDVQETDADGADEAGAEDLLTEDDTVADADDTDAADSADSDDANATDQSDVENADAEDADAEDADAEDANADKAKNEDGLVEDLISDNEQEDDNTIPAFVPKGIERKNNYLSPVTTTTSGWVTEDGEDYYYVNGQKVTDQFMQIGDNLYHFEWDGALTKSELFGYYAGEDEDNNIYLHNYYYANEDGTLVVNDWYIDEWDDRYYFGEAGVGAQGVVTLDGVAYLFHDGYLQRNSSYRKGNTYYISDENGVAYEVNNNGWNVVNGKTYYMENGEKISNQVKNIDGKLYAFQSDGERVENETYSIWYYDEDLDEWEDFSVRAHADGTLYVNEWYEDEWEDRYYYGADGKAINGVQEIDGVLYLFDDGEIWKNGNTTIGNQIYISDDNGVAYPVNDNGWNQIGNTKYYFENGKKITNQIKKIDGKHYGFNSNGKLYVNEAFSLSTYDPTTDQWDYGYYYAKEDGTLCVNEWRTDEWGSNLYYQSDGKRMGNGICNIDGVDYLFRYSDLWKNGVYEENGNIYFSDENGVATLTKQSDGWITNNDSVYYLENGKLIKNQIKKIGDHYYYFGDDGHRYENSFFGRSVYDEQGNYKGYYNYYAKEGGILATNEWYYDCYYGSDGAEAEGIVTIDGVTYLFRDGRLSSNSSYKKDNQYYLSDEKGIAHLIQDEGWVTIGENTYYFEKGELITNQVKVIDGKKYVFNQNGIRVTNGFCWIKEYDEDGWWSGSSSYRTKEDGTLLVNEWYENGWGDKYYYGSDGKGVKGLQTIDGKQFYFSEDGCVRRNALIETNNGTYLLDDKGALHIVKSDGWIEATGKRYYIENGQLWSERGLKEIDGVTYAFGNAGYALSDTEIVFYGQNDWRGSTYAVKPDGSICRNEWYKGKYYREDGTQVRASIYTIDGKDYLFGQYGDPVSNTVTIHKNKTYQTGENGEILEVVSDGWHEAKDSNGSYQYYVKEGIMLRNTAIDIDGVYYGFDANGHLAGHRGFAGKVKWTASSNSGNPYNPNSGNNTNPYENTGNSYDPYDLEMNFTHSVGYKVASANNYAPYVATSNAYNPYYTDETGKLLHNTWYDIEEDGKTFRCYFDDTYQKVAGWLELDGETYYFDMLGNLQTGWQDIYYKNGEYNRYYFDKDGKMLKGTHIIDGKEYFFDSKGIYRADGKDPNVPDKGETLVMEDGKFVYYEDGVKNDEKYGFVEYGGSKFLVANGEVATSKQGLAQDPENPSEWYFCASGKVTTNITKLVMYNGSTFFVRNGKLDNSVNGFLKYDTGLFFVSKGRVIKTANGLVQDPNNKKDWYFCANGQVQAKKTGVVIYNKAGFYVKNGKLDSSYNGNATYNGKTVKIVNGRMK